MKNAITFESLFADGLNVGQLFLCRKPYRRNFSGAAKATWYLTVNGKNPAHTIIAVPGGGAGAIAPQVYKIWAKSKVFGQ